MDPFSITTGAVALITASFKAGVELKKLSNGAAEASKNVRAMLADLKALRSVLESIEDGFEELDGKAPLAGFMGSHWMVLQTCLKDGCDSMERLTKLLQEVNKDVSFMDSARRHVRLKSASDQIAVHRHEIQAYKDALHLSLQSVTFFQQTMIREDTTNLLRRSETLHQDLSRLAANLDVKLTALESMVGAKQRPNSNASVRHLKDCVQSAAKIVSSASTVMSEKVGDSSGDNWDFASEFGDWFNSDLNDLTLRWIQSQEDDSRSPAGIFDKRPSKWAPSPSPPEPVPSKIWIKEFSDDHDLGKKGLMVDNGRPGDDKLAKSPVDTETPAPVTTTISPKGAAAEKARRRKSKSLSVSSIFASRPKSRNADTESNSQKRRGNDAMVIKDLSVNSMGSVPIKFCFVGDGACGKTCFMIVTSKGVFPEKVFVPTVFENYVANFMHDDVRFEASLWDTAGQDDYDRIRPLSYGGTHVFCVCFCVDSLESVDDVIEKWIPEINHHNQTKAPIFLLGLKKDLRYNPRTIEELRKVSQKPTSIEDGETIARRVGAQRYLECSSLTGEGVSDVFKTMLGMVVEANPSLKKGSDDYRKRRRGLWRFLR
ncbi:hypothetical protein QQS21_009566 [Conoideocrella luteorostrata]|uniref:Azaphilone pigments biosynthesis cluster protein L N-terminal domain-containing protein n=1 Tax=Conoideocrella luteorostrata TaxID=1105319 RepID=A0AAJ0FVI5_9HYPO|nr:hypothetical protein QQS21_009566 [Conoideocrella luteorostrata]